MEYWRNLPSDHRSTLFSMREEDFVAELDAQLKYHLRICRDCRSNVLRALKELKPGRSEGGSAVKGSALPLCSGHGLRLSDGMVVVERVKAAHQTAFFERAIELSDGQVSGGFFQGSST